MDLRGRFFWLFCTAILFVSTSFSTSLNAHSGGLNAAGCHGGSRPYHCHRAPSEMVRTRDGRNRLRCDLGSQSRECSSTRRSATATRTRVLNLQIQLRRHCSGLPADFASGTTSQVTTRALASFQRVHGLAVDGIYGPQTARALAQAPTGKCRLRTDGSVWVPPNPEPELLVLDTSPLLDAGKVQSIQPEADGRLEQATLSRPSAETTTTSRQGWLQLDREKIRLLQAQLNILDFDAGPEDGIVGPRTIRAVSDYRRSSGMPDDGIIGADLLQQVNAAVLRSSEGTQSSGGTFYGVKRCSVSGGQLVECED